MLAITVPHFADPSAYALSEIERPSIGGPNELIIKVQAASINPIDVKKAHGKSKFAVREEFPYRIGYDAAGTVTEIGSGVKGFSTGDAVYVRLPEVSRGSWAEEVVVDEFFVAHKPDMLSFVEAASMPLAAMIAMQALELYAGDLEGKTVLIPAGLSGTGLIACQLAKNVFNAGEVITTVSTSKVAQVPQLLGQGVVDKVIDYQQEDVQTAIPKGSVDFYLDTVGDCMQHLSLMRPGTGHIVSIATLPSGPQMQASGIMRRPGNPQVPFHVKAGLSLLDGIKRLRARRWGSKYQYLMLEPSGDRLRQLSGYVAQGKLRTVVGQTADLRDIEAVKKLCHLVYSGKGGTGKMVIVCDRK